MTDKKVQVGNVVFSPSAVIGFQYHLLDPKDNAGIETYNYYRLFFANNNNVIEIHGRHEEIKPAVEKILKALIE